MFELGDEVLQKIAKKKGLGDELKAKCQHNPNKASSSQPVNIADLQPPNDEHAHTPYDVCNAVCASIAALCVGERDELLQNQRKVLEDNDKNTGRFILEPPNTSSDINQEWLDRWFQIMDILIFAGRLAPYCKVVWEEEPRKPSTRGHCSYEENEAGIKGAIIKISVRSNGTENTYMFTLLHEMAHAVLLIYCCNKSFRCLSLYVEGVGSTGHGYYWHSIMAAMDDACANNVPIFKQLKRIIREDHAHSMVKEILEWARLRPEVEIKKEGIKKWDAVLEGLTGIEASKMAELKSDLDKVAKKSMKVLWTQQKKPIARSVAQIKHPDLIQTSKER